MLIPKYATSSTVSFIMVAIPLAMKKSPVPPTTDMSLFFFDGSTPNNVYGPLVVGGVGPQCEAKPSSEVDFSIAQIQALSTTNRRRMRMVV